jgi:hypothetical protein
MGKRKEIEMIAAILFTILICLLFPGLMILLAVLLGFTFLYLAVSIAAHAETPFAEKRARCFLQVEGVVHIDGICDLTSTTLPGEPPGGFQTGTGTNERFLVSWLANID